MLLIRSLVGNESTAAQRKELISLFDEMINSDEKMVALEMVFTVTVFNGLTDDAYKIGDTLRFKNIIGCNMYLDRALQGRVSNMSNIIKLE